MNSAVGELNLKIDEFSLVWKLTELHTFAHQYGLFYVSLNAVFAKFMISTNIWNT